MKDNFVFNNSKKQIETYNINDISTKISIAAVTHLFLNKGSHRNGTLVKFWITPGLKIIDISGINPLICKNEQPFKWLVNACLFNTKLNKTKCYFQY